MTDLAMNDMTPVDIGDDDEADAIRLAAALVSKRCGLITELVPQGRGPEEPCPPHLWNATLTHYNFWNTSLGMRLTGGKGLTEARAKLSAMGEAIERYSAFHWDPHRIRVGLASETAITPPDCVLYSPTQYAAGSKYLPWDRSVETSWITGIELPTGAPVDLPASLVYLLGPPPRVEDNFTAITSNGLAAGKDLTHAILGGAYEVIERDAFMLTWLNKLPATRIKTPEHGCHAARIIRHYNRFGLTIRLLSLATDGDVTVVMAIAENPDDDGAFRHIGLGSNVDPVAATDQAVFELCQMRPGIRSRTAAGEYRERLSTYDGVRTIDDHVLFHFLATHAHEFDFLAVDGAECDLADLPRPGCQSAQDELDIIVRSVTGAGARIAYVDITAPDIAPLGPSVVRVIITGFQPISFGHGEGRHGGARLYDAPVRWGLRKAPLTEAALNQCPHPLA